MANDLVKYTTEHGEVALSSDIIKRYLVPSDSRVTDQEVGLFLQLCKYQKLNPFLREVYLVKYGDQAASMVTGKETFVKRAQANPNYAGMEAGIVVMGKDGKVTKREGSMRLTDETLLGGWAKIHIKGYSVPIYDEVSLEEYQGKTKDGQPTKMWREKPATMIRKVAIVHALREAFPEQFAGLYSQEEVNTIDASVLPETPVVIPADVAEVAPDPEVLEQSPDPEPPPEVKESTAGDYVLQFGRHKGKSIRHVFETDRGWLDWYSKQPDAKEPAIGFVKKFLAFPDTKANAKKPVPAAVSSAPVQEYAANDYPLPFDV